MKKSDVNKRVSGKVTTPSNNRGVVEDITFKPLNVKKVDGNWPSTPAPGKSLGLVGNVPVHGNSSILSSGPVGLPRDGGPSDSPKG